MLLCGLRGINYGFVPWGNVSNMLESELDKESSVGHGLIKGRLDKFMHI